MSLSADDRANLFGTYDLQLQIQRCLRNKPLYRESEENLRAVFCNVSEGAYLSVIISLCIRGVLRKDSGFIYLEIGHIMDSDIISDRVWRAIRIEKRFTSESIANLTGLDIRQIDKVFRKLKADGHIASLGWDFSSRKRLMVYRLVTDTIVRPRQYSDAAELVWRALYGLRGSAIQPRDVIELVGDSVSGRHIRKILRQFSDYGYIELSFHSKRKSIFGIPVDIPARCPRVQVERKINGKKQK